MGFLKDLSRLYQKSAISSHQSQKHGRHQHNKTMNVADKIAKLKAQLEDLENLGPLQEKVKAAKAEWEKLKAELKSKMGSKASGIKRKRLSETELTELKDAVKGLLETGKTGMGELKKVTKQSPSNIKKALKSLGAESQGELRKMVYFLKK